MQAIEHGDKAVQRGGAGLGHHAECAGTLVNLVPADGAVVHGLVTNDDMHGDDVDVVALADLDGNIRARLRNNDELAHGQPYLPNRAARCSGTPKAGYP